MLVRAGRFGQTTPPLVEFLKDILRRYPEGGQILKVDTGLLVCLFVCSTSDLSLRSPLKELIQNAEDAGATEVKFMYDETEHGVESLWSPDMAQHQGNALPTGAVRNFASKIITPHTQYI